MLDRIGHHAQSAASRLHVRSALNPLLWLTGIATPLCLVGALVFEDASPAFEVLIFMGMLPIAVTCLGFMYFALFKPEKLQSEDYQIRHESLQLIQQKSGNIEIPVASLEQIVNPAISHQLNTGGKQ